MSSFYLFGALLVPALGALAISILGKNLAKWIALATSVIGLGLVLQTWCDFRGDLGNQIQFAFTLPWIASYGVSFGLGVDSLSMPLLLLAKMLLPIAVLSSWDNEKKPKAMMACLLLLDLGISGVFVATDVLLFYIFWELLLIPAVLILGVWGSGQKVAAALKFFLYTFAGSIFMLAALIWIFVSHGTQTGVWTTDIAALAKTLFPSGSSVLGLSVQHWVYLGLLAAFIVKIPLFPFHRWLPDTYSEAPTAGSILFSGVLSKLGIYGMLRLAIPLAPEGFASSLSVFSILSIVSIFYAAWIAFQQSDLKKIIAFSSMSHLGLIAFGVCSLNVEGLNGVVFQMMSHGIVSAALFFMVGILEKRRGSRAIEDFGGLADTAPLLTFLFVVASCASMAVPGLSGFVGEFLILAGTFPQERILTSLATLSVVLGAAYTLRMIRLVFFGTSPSAEAKIIPDMKWQEFLAVIPLLLIMLWWGLSPLSLQSKIQGGLEKYWAKENYLISPTVPKPESK